MTDASQDEVINASEKDIINCQFHQWFSTYEKNTMKSIIITLPERFISYLLQDGVVLPSSESNAFGRDELSDDEDLTEKGEEFPLDREDFTALTAEITSAIKQLKGEVFVKFNWSAPSDAAWLRGGSLKCTDSADIYLLLKSSDRIVYDIENMFNLCSQCTKKRPDNHTLVLRKWANLDPAMEFRVFVGKNHILGISQRDCASYYDYLITEKEKLEDIIVDFWEEKIAGKFLMERYSVDVFIDRKKRVWIVDFNPFGDPSSGLLFEWRELQALILNIPTPTATVARCVGGDPSSIDNTEHTTNVIEGNPIIETEREIDFEFRIINHQRETFASPSGSSRGPIDVTLAPDFHKFMEICKNQDKEEADDEN